MDVWCFIKKLLCWNCGIGENRFVEFSVNSPLLQDFCHSQMPETRLNYKVVLDVFGSSWTYSDIDF